MRAEHWETGDSLDRHLALIRQQTIASMHDPETRGLAVAIASGAYDRMVDPATGKALPVIPYHKRYYIGAESWAAAQRQCAARDEMCEITRIWNFAVLNIRYLGDIANQDTYATLQATLESGGGDCDDFTVAFGALCGAIGYRSVARVVSVTGQNWDHIYPVIQTKKRGWVPLDATEPGKVPGWEFKRAARKRDFVLV